MGPEPPWEISRAAEVSWLQKFAEVPKGSVKLQQVLRSWTQVVQVVQVAMEGLVAAVRVGSLAMAGAVVLVVPVVPVVLVEAVVLAAVAMGLAVVQVGGAALVAMGLAPVLEDMVLVGMAQVGVADLVALPLQVVPWILAHQQADTLSRAKVASWTDLAMAKVDLEDMDQVDMGQEQTDMGPGPMDMDQERTALVGQTAWGSMGAAVPKIEVKQVEKVVEVPNIEYRDRLVEVREVREVVRRVPRIEVREIPIERIIQVPKKVVQEVEQPVYRPVPHLVKQNIEREIPVPKPYTQTLEVVKQVSVPTNADGVVLPQSDVTPTKPVQNSGPSPAAAESALAVLSAPVISRTYELPPVRSTPGESAPEAL
ncbi:Uncharacterized protein SCF082_LOCUS12400 [Durusdinium trenchii]|uniref:Uncharacterized protein n=1 Tax=Durusdinium trenchii TaxID=1381693 RepID=A0ABP0JJN2_9DINO